MGFIYQIVVVTFLVAFIFLAVEVVAALCRIGIRGFVKAVEDKIVYYPRAASVLAFFKIPDFLLVLLTVFAVWFLQENKLSGFIQFHDDTSVEKSLFTLAISADIGLTALLSLAITFLHSLRSAHEDSVYLERNPYNVYLQKQWPFKLVTSQIFGLYVIGLYALPLVSAALCAFYGNAKQWFTQFSEDSILFDIWLSVYCAALLILAFTVYVALRFNHSSQ